MNQSPATSDAKQRDSAIDTLKCVAAMMVVVLHYGYLTVDNAAGTLSFAVNWLMRVAVPLFFMITGFYFVLSYQRGRLKRQFKRLCSLTAFAILLYAVFEVAWHLAIGRFKVLAQAFTWHDNVLTELSKILIFNDIPIAFHLWYLLAAIYALGAMWVFERYKLWCKPLALFWVLMFAVTAYMSGFNDIDYPYERNFITVAIPSMVVGRCLYEHYATHPARQMPASAIFICIAVAIIMVVVQMAWHTSQHGHAVSSLIDMPIAIPLLATSLMLLALRFPTLGASTPLPAIGAKYSGYIYVFHIIPGTVLRTWFHADSYLTFLLPFIVFAIALAMAVVWVRIRSSLASP